MVEVRLGLSAVSGALSASARLLNWVMTLPFKTPSCISCPVNQSGIHRPRSCEFSHRNLAHHLRPAAALASTPDQNRRLHNVAAKGLHCTMRRDMILRLEGCSSHRDIELS